MYFRKKTSGGRAYLQIVHARREGTRIRQQVIARLGRLDELTASGQLERLLRSGARFAAKAMVLAAVQESTASEIEVRRLGPGLVFERSWAETGCRACAAPPAPRSPPGSRSPPTTARTPVRDRAGAPRFRSPYSPARPRAPSPWRQSARPSAAAARAGRSPPARRGGRA